MRRFRSGPSRSDCFTSRCLLPASLQRLAISFLQCGLICGCRCPTPLAAQRFGSPADCLAWPPADYKENTGPSGEEPGGSIVPIRPCGPAAPDLTTPSTVRSFRREKRKGRAAIAGPLRSQAEPLGAAGLAEQIRALFAALPDRRRS